MSRPRLRALAAAILLTALVVPAAAGPAAAATPRLTLVTATTYDVLPDEGRVAVTVRLTATNRLRDTVARRFFFRTAYLVVQPGTSGFEISGRGTPDVSVRRRADDHTLLRIDIGTNLAAGRSRTLTLRFNLRDPGGAPDRAVRISPSLVRFDAWAYATPDTPGSRLTVTLPADYDVAIGQGPLNGPTTTEDGRQAWSSGRLEAPLEFVAEVVAERPAELVETSKRVALAEGDAQVLLRAWPDDPAWRDRVGDLVTRVLPVMERQIGVPWPIDGPLVIEESIAPAGSGQAGVFEPAEDRLSLSYAAPDAVVVQQLAHAWFNGRLVADRWIAEGFARYYGERVSQALEIEPASSELTEELEAAAVPLNGWSPGGGDPLVDAYGRAAALALAREIGDRAGPGSLAQAWNVAADGIGAYQPEPGREEPLPTLLDWRSLLDLLEDGTGQRFDDLWLRWVARPTDEAALAERSAVREHYARTVTNANGWSLPRTVRDALRAWQFGVAEELLAAADRVLAARGELDAQARAAGVILSDRLRRTFEGEDGFAVAEAEAAAQLAAVAAIREAQAARPPGVSAVDELVVALGLIGVDPGARLAEASAALAEGDVAGAFEAAATAEDLWAAATDVGRARIVSTGLLSVSVVLLIGLIGLRRRGSLGTTASG